MKSYQNLDELFYDLIESAEIEIKKSLSEYSKLYILNLLKKLAKTNDLFTNEFVKEMAIAEIFMEAFHRNLFEKINMLKLAGDLSLILSGLYPESLNKKLVDIDYYIKMGRSSYKELANIYANYSSKLDIMNLYVQLKREFLNLVEILTEIADELNFINRNNLSNIQLRWHKSGISKYKKILDENKIIPLYDNFTNKN
ncbi:hypothetical protein FHQ18_02225 [Deferribacter autotrophicus]|uniref:Uncharacterized protein n=1 Tax=Deferribacter autotrophicus TaxID=500465 RepID=A0A5A8F5J5_9BACT|nr:hypothetical protein [Deferribacter autotrophicus]KAA0258785.1 hypothetical protein FHQ18_02225 [Deferribacter autotrophicus]